MKTLRAPLMLCALVLLIFPSACATTGLGAAPLDQDLVNDGSAEAQARLVRNYQVAYTDGRITRPHADPDALDLDEVWATATSDDAHNYLETSAAAARELETIPVSLARFTSSSTMYYGLALGFALAGAGVALAIGLPPMISDSMDGGGTPSSLSWLGLSWDVAAGAFTGWIVSWPFMLLNSILVVPFFSGMAAPDYKESVRAFNEDLQRRVERGAQAASGAQPPTTPEPAKPPEQLDGVDDEEDEPSSAPQPVDDDMAAEQPMDAPAAE